MQPGTPGPQHDKLYETSFTHRPTGAAGLRSDARSRCGHHHVMKLTTLERAFLLWLKRWPRGETFKKYDTIAKELGCTPVTIRSMVCRLKKAGCISSQNRKFIRGKVSKDMIIKYLTDHPAMLVDHPAMLLANNTRNNIHVAGQQHPKAKNASDIYIPNNQVSSGARGVDGALQLSRPLTTRTLATAFIAPGIARTIKTLKKLPNPQEWSLVR